jgi:hypothetical protein
MGTEMGTEMDSVPISVPGLNRRACLMLATH